jgi:hypothetical protein
MMKKLKSGNLKTEIEMPVRLGLSWVPGFLIKFSL